MKEFLWSLESRCTNDCPYCAYRLNGVREKLSAAHVRRPVPAWLKAWERMRSLYGGCLIHITGVGEPTLFPGFIELAAGLASLHSMNIDTNLSWSLEELARFAKAVPAQNVRMETSFHPLSMELSSFLEKAVFLKERGFACQCRWVAYPPIMDRLPEYRARFQERGLLFTVTPFMGEFQNSRYPDAYGEEQRRDILRVCREERLRHGTAANPELIEHLCRVHQEAPTGRLCRSGCEYAFILPDASVHRCQQYGFCGWERLGSILDEDFRLPLEPSVCRSPLCGSEFRWCS
ncbi:MAG: hypothetical protein WCU88_13430 [Elusimicrobiota bacterium]|jgi:MoaA/NifB/PqqE/SkfB family radical SAM enzyme